MHRQIHHRIKSAREDSGRTAAWMAKKIGVHRNTYRDIENGLVDLRVSQLKIISEITGRPISWFVYGRDGVESIQEKYEEDIDKINKLLSGLPAVTRSMYYRVSIEMLEFIDVYLSGNKPPGAGKRKN